MTQDTNPFEVSHLFDDGAGGIWRHPGTEEDCQLPDCLGTDTPAA